MVAYGCLFLVFVIVAIYVAFQCYSIILAILYVATSQYRKQQILHGTKLLRFLRIFDKTRKFSLLISMACSNTYCNLTKPRQFSLHSAKKPVNCKSFVSRRICSLQYITYLPTWLLCMYMILKYANRYSYVPKSSQLAS